jgi:hypothetical protein
VHNDWPEHKNLFLDFKHNTEIKLDTIETKLDRILSDVNMLRGKAVVWGAITAALITLITNHLLK